MADDRSRKQGMKEGGVDVGQQNAGVHESPGRNPGIGQQAGERDRDLNKQDKGKGFDPSRGGDGGSYKKEQDEQTRR